MKPAATIIKVISNKNGYEEQQKSRRRDGNKFLLTTVMLNKQDIVASTCNKTPQCHCMEEAHLFLKRKIQNTNWL